MSFGAAGAAAATAERCASGRAGSRSTVDAARKPSGFVGTFTRRKSFFLPAMMEPRVASAGASARSPAAKIAQRDLALRNMLGRGPDAPRHRPAEERDVVDPGAIPGGGDQVPHESGHPARPRQRAPVPAAMETEPVIEASGEPF